jgi:phosphoribosylformylglycinamidine (FGAM) synthase PurS component
MSLRGSVATEAIYKMRYTIEVKIKPKFTDAKADDFKHQAYGLGIKKIKQVRVGRLFRLEGNLTKRQIKRIKDELLTDKVVEDSNLYRFSKNKSVCKIEVWLKSAVSDVVGESVKGAILDMGIKAVTDARCGEIYYITRRLTKKELKFLAEKILVNPLVHDYRVWCGEK